MNTESERKIPDRECIPGVAAALDRARMRARELAYRTGTPLIVLVNGKIERRMITAEDLDK